MSASTLPDVTLYVPARNAGATLRPCLDAIAQLDPAPGRVLVIYDPSSVDETPAIAHGSLSVTAVAQQRSGLPAARNMAFELSETDWVASVDGDVVVAPDWLGQLWQARGALPRACAIAGRTEERIRTGADAWRALMVPHHWGAHTMDGPYMVVCDALFRRETVVGVGGYSESLVRYGDDARLSRDLRDAGYRLGYTPNARALHLRSDTTLGILDLRWKYSEPRQAGRLQDLAGLESKLAVNSEYGRVAVARALSAGEPLLALIGAALPLHHAIRDIQALVGTRRVPAKSCAHAVGTIAAIALHAASGWAGLGRMFGRWFALPRELDDVGPSPFGPRWGAYAAGVTKTLRDWVRECAPLVGEPDDTRLDEPLAADVERWAERYGGPRDPGAPGRLWAPPRPVAPWPAAKARAIRAASCGAPDLHWATRFLANRTALVLSNGPAPAALQAARRVEHFDRPSSLPSAAAGVVVIPALDDWPSPLDVLACVLARPRSLVVSYQAPSRLTAGLEVVLAADIAEAAAAAGLSIDHFELLAGQVQLAAGIGATFL